MTPPRSAGPPRWLARPLDGAGLASLSGEGVREVALPLHGARSEVHDWVAGAHASFRDAIDALAAARALGLTVTVWTRLTRSNARVLDAMPALLRARAVSRWLVVVASARDAASPPFTRVVPRLGLALPSALAALAEARRLGLDARILGAPRCALGPFADLAAPSPPRAYAPVCDACPSRDVCPGLDAEYLARFGAGELRPAPRVSPPPFPVFDEAPR
ncbi:MAG: hypothetical protein KF729_27275 [Sandaracinaceae bacterium]|nr:hypothetical protein [Sandaracinaceae bacterium]